MEKINIAEMLKNCPSGMELDCTMFNNVKFDGIDAEKFYPIRIKIGEDKYYLLTEYGRWNNSDDAKCVIFPKGKATWEGFHRPFKDGDILATDLGSVFYLNTHLNNDEYYGCYVGIGSSGSFHICEPFAYKECCGFATEKEKEKLFKAIKDKGCRWNAETKTLEKIIQPKFKVGDRIRHKEKTKWTCVIRRIDDRYWVDEHPMCFTLPFGKQDEYELIPNKFDITTLKPFDKVLVNDNISKRWRPNLFGCLRSDDDYPYEVIGGVYWKRCIPYEGNEHLLNKTNDCDEFYKTWKE